PATVYEPVSMSIPSQSRLAVAVSARVPRDRTGSRGDELRARLLPGVPGLTAAVKEQHRGAVRGAVSVRNELDPARAAESQPDGIEQIVRITHDLQHRKYADVTPYERTNQQSRSMALSVRWNRQ